MIPKGLLHHTPKASIENEYWYTLRNKETVGNGFPLKDALSHRMWDLNWSDKNYPVDRLELPIQLL